MNNPAAVVTGTPLHSCGPAVSLIRCVFDFKSKSVLSSPFLRQVAQVTVADGCAFCSVGETGRSSSDGTTTGFDSTLAKDVDYLLVPSYLFICTSFELKLFPRPTNSLPLLSTLCPPHPLPATARQRLLTKQTDSLPSSSRIEFPVRVSHTITKPRVLLSVGVLSTISFHPPADN